MPKQPIDPQKIALLNAALNHVPFDGWSKTTFDAAVTDVGMNPVHAATMCPRGAVDLAITFHQQGDDAMVAAIKDADLREMRFRDKVAFAIRARIAAVSDKEAVRRGSTLFALPHMAPVGAKLIWGTADTIWTALGDTSQDVNWYTKRMTLSGVYTSVILFWLGDDSVDGQATHDFIDRRINDVMQFEKVKASVRDNPLFKPFAGPFAKMMSAVKAPPQMPDMDVPGMWRTPE